jgi:hypothetical protein
MATVRSLQQMKRRAQRDAADAATKSARLGESGSESRNQFLSGRSREEKARLMSDLKVRPPEVGLCVFLRL